MPIDFPRLLAAVPLSTGTTTVYTVPASTRTQVTSIEVIEGASAPEVFSLWRNNESAPNILADSAPIVAGGFVKWNRTSEDPDYLYLNDPGDTIEGRKSGAGSALVIVRGTEVAI